MSKTKKDKVSRGVARHIPDDILIAQARRQFSGGLDIVISTAIGSALSSEEMHRIGISPMTHRDLLLRAHATATANVRALADVLRNRAAEMLDRYEASLGRIAELEAELIRLRESTAKSQVTS